MLLETLISSNDDDDKDNDSIISEIVSKGSKAFILTIGYSLFPSVLTFYGAYQGFNLNKDILSSNFKAEKIKKVCLDARKNNSARIVFKKQSECK